MSDDSIVAAATAQLYGVPPADFVRERTTLVAQAKESGDEDAAAAIGALRKPTTSAAALNQAARRRPDAIGELLRVGAALRNAQSKFDASTLSALRSERDAAVQGVVRAAEEIAAEDERRLSAATVTEVHDTAVAALADAAAAEAVASATLTRGLSYSGFGEVDLHEAVAYLPSGGVLTVIEGDGEDGSGRGASEVPGDGDTDRPGSAPAEDDLDAGDLERAEHELEEAEAALRAAQKRAKKADQRLETLRGQLDAAKVEATAAAAASTEARRQRKRLQTRLERLRSRRRG